MRFVTTLGLLLLSIVAHADDYQRLWQAAGWPQQQAHFAQALGSAQQSYQSSLPPAVYQALLSSSNQRFASADVEQRALTDLRQALPQPQPAIRFFESTLGRKVVAAEVSATTASELRRNAQGVPKIKAEATRRLLIRHLAQGLPAADAGAEVSLALAGVAADSLSQMLPGLLGGGQTQGLLQGQRQRLIQQINADLDNTLLHVYRTLSDPELEEFVSFVESDAGRAYYQSALSALRAGLNP